ncbi:MAG TPA: DUF3108 domain-containing protein [Aquabacterium sp.]|uniref:DUF3108 domain-containing protein n=1 Tax=Aquabacterium sp. TaxID=1872578 RepID=UPI002E35CDAE|nr:DUF3108 domain-containing protein [Aquabacterium sp.]HEX5373709.1 DUF3108 domain-containing protein [Aquabacterium sp.]
MARQGDRAASRPRALALGAIIATVVAAHALLTQFVMLRMQEMSPDQAPTIKRMEASLVADMELTAPPVVSAPPAVPTQPVAAPRPAPRAASAASRPEPKPSAPEAASSPTEPVSEPIAVALAPSAPASAPEAATPAASAAASAPAFEWPQATRVTFKMEGYLRGPIYGSAQVEWVREDMRYQVHVDAYAGPSFAPIASQRWTSEGTISPDGLTPGRFESINKLLIKSSAPKIVTFDEQEVVLPNGDRFPKMPGVQDPASHYIQMAYQFMLKPGLLKVGNTIEMPLAWTKKQETVTYDVDGEEALDTPLGKVDTFRLKPRKFQNSKGDEVLADIWIAPSLQYLPIRMLIRVGKDNYFDMKMDKAPQQAPGGSTQAPRAASDPL